MNLLIVDDEEMEAEVIQKLIDWDQVRISNVYTAYSARQAIEVLKQNYISIVLSDIEMPRGSGHDLAKWIQENKPETVVIFLTGHADFTYAAAAIRLDVVDYLLKPVDAGRLREALERAVKRVPGGMEEEGDLSAPEVVRRIKLYVKENCGQEITRAKLAEKYFIHPDYLSRIFREQAGIPFSNYIIKVRVKRAKQLLMNTNQTISYIAAAVGYSNTAYFAKHFKRETGETPKEYRKHMRDER